MFMLMEPMRDMAYGDTGGGRKPRDDARRDGALAPCSPRPAWGSWEWNPRTGAALWSEETCRIYGTDPRAAAPGVAAFNPRVLAEDRPAAHAALRATLEKGMPYSVEFRIARDDGTVRLLHDEGAISRRRQGKAANLTGIVRDVTDHREVEDALRASEACLEHAQRIAHMGLFEWDLESGRMKWSDELFRILGLDPAPGVASAAVLMERAHPEDRQRLGAITRAERAGRSGANLEYRIVRPNGEIRYLSARYEAETAPPDGSMVIKGIVQDISERKSLEERFRHTKNIEAIGNLTGGIAHEFNNLLFVILGNLDLLEDCLARDGDLLQLIEAARRGALRGANLTERLLALSQRQYLRPERLYLNHLIPDMVPLLQGAVGEKVTLKTRMSESLWPVFADRGQIDNALFLLAANARDAMPDGGNITIVAENVVIDEQEAANHADAESGAYVRLSMRDDGSGMTPDVIENAVTPFFTTKAVGKGAGLGLSMVFGFASQSGGFAKIESRVREGSTVALYLPKAGDQNMADEAEATGPAAKTILVVEDEPEVRELVSTLLRELGYRVIEAGDGRAARAVLEGDERIDLLFSDIAMPHGLNGPRVAEIGRRLRPDIKLLFMSGYREEFLSDSGQVMAGVPIIWKPYEKEEMAKMVARALDDSSAQ